MKNNFLNKKTLYLRRNHVGKEVGIKITGFYSPQLLNLQLRAIFPFFSFSPPNCFLLPTHFSLYLPQSSSIPLSFFPLCISQLDLNPNTKPLEIAHNGLVYASPNQIIVLRKKK